MAGTYAKITVPLGNLHYDVECTVDLEVEWGGEFAKTFDFEILDWEEWEDEERPFRRNDKSEIIGERLWDTIDASEALREELRLKAIDNYDGAPTE
jgi:hypothetical protein